MLRGKEFHNLIDDRKRSICMNHNYIEGVGDGVGAH